MATFYGTTDNVRWTYKMDVYELSQDIGRNQTVVRVDVWLGRASNAGSAPLGGDWSGSVTVDGQTQGVSGTIQYIPSVVPNQQVYLYTRDFTVDHNDDGSKTIDVSSSMSSGNFTPHSASAGGRLVLTTIPRASSITATSAYIEEVSQLTVTKKSAGFNHSISFNFGGLTGYINADGTVSQTRSIYGNTSIGFTIPSEWYEKIPNAQSGVGTIYIETYSGNNKIGDTQRCSITARVNPETNKPILIATVIDVNDETIALSGSENTLINDFSQARVDWNANTLNI